MYKEKNNWRLIENWKNKPMTIERLKELCEEQIKLGNKDKYIFISQDEEGNGFHALFFPFISEMEEIEKYEDQLYEIEKEDFDKIVLLG